MKVYKGNEPLFNYYTNLFWLLGLVTSALLSTYILNKKIAKEAKLRKQNKVGLNHERYNWP